MSTIRFTNQDIIDIFAACWNYGSAGSLDALRRFERFALAANQIQQANTVAYYATYPEESREEYPAITANVIKYALMTKTIASQDRAFSNLRSIRYNLYSNDGQDFAIPDILDALLELTQNQVEILTSRAENRANSSRYEIEQLQAKVKRLEEQASTIPVIHAKRSRKRPVVVQ